MPMTIKPRHLLAALLLIAELPILAALAAGWLVGAVFYGIGLAGDRAGSHLRAVERDRGAWLARLASWRRRRRPPRPGRAAWGR
jgi:hypothetical protein